MCSGNSHSCHHLHIIQNRIRATTVRVQDFRNSAQDFRNSAAHSYVTHILTYLHTYLLTPWSRDLLEKLTVSHPVKKFSAIYGTRRFITALTSACHLSLSCACPIQSIYLHTASSRTILTLFTHLRPVLPSGPLPSCFPNKALYTHSSDPQAPHSQPILFFSILSPAKHCVRNTIHLAPRYAVYSIPALPCTS